MPELPDLLASLPSLTRPDGTPVRALVVDDEPLLADLVALGLRKVGWEATTAHDGYEAVTRAAQIHPDVLVLDWMMPGLDGVEVLQRVRATQPHIPALMLTARDAVENKLTGLAAGADDYVTKPFSVEEVLFRLHRLVERSGAVTPAPTQLVVGDLLLDTETREVTRGGDAIDLTATQFALLRYLMENQRVVLSRGQILGAVWGSEELEGQGNVVDLFISYLRKKVDAGHEPMIHTVRGVGYVLRPA